MEEAELFSDSEEEEVVTVVSTRGRKAIPSNRLPPKMVNVARSGGGKPKKKGDKSAGGKKKVEVPTRASPRKKTFIDDEDDEDVDAEAVNKVDLQTVWRAVCPGKDESDDVHSILDKLGKEAVDSLADLLVMDYKSNKKAVIWEAFKSRVQSQLEKQDTREILDNANAQVAKLELDLRKATASASRMKGVKLKVAAGDHVLATIKRHVDIDLWMTTKFLVTPEDIDDACMDIMSMMGLKLSGMEEACWIETYKAKMCGYLNKRRDYLFSELRKLTFIRYKETNVWPTAQDILACATRTTKDMELFKWYVDQVLAKVVSTKQWEPVHKYYKIPSAALHSEIKNKTKLFPSGHEALIVLAFDNNEVRWPKQYEHKEAGGEKELKMNGKYTKADTGQKTTGWNAEGLEKFTKYIEEIKTARKNPQYTALEKECLVQLRKDNGIVCRDADSQSRFNKRKRKFGEEMPITEVAKATTKYIKTKIEVSDVEEDMDDGLDEESLSKV